MNIFIKVIGWFKRVKWMSIATTVQSGLATGIQVLIVVVTLIDAMKEMKFDSIQI
jgi:hypothetical protein